MKKKSWSALILFIVIVEGIGFLSGILSGDIKAAYAALELPPLSPPDWLFGIVWPVLYAMMAIAAYLIYTSNDSGKSNALFVFCTQLALNFCWSIVFFRWEVYWAAALIIIVLDFLVAYTIYLFKQINVTASRLMIPYLLWLIFATYLNLGIAILN